MAKQIMQLSGFLILIGGGIFYFYLRSAPPPEPVKVYKVPERSPQRLTSAEGKLVDDSQAGHTHTHVGHAHPPQTVYADHVPVHGLPASEISDAPEVLATDAADPVASTTKVPTSTGEDIAPWVIEQFEKLNVWFHENYPDINEVSTMTPEEFLEAYPTDEAQEVIQERAREVQSLLFGQLRDLFAEVPPSSREEILSGAKAHFTKMWGAETANMVMAKLRAELDL